MKYIKKRNFKTTAEPKGGKAGGKKLSFVVQRHHATRLHYDFRLELDGVLKSWAVPKGPSMNPKDKRLAMMVEDHPYDYKFFEGTIPKGNYGAGVVTRFDEGTYSPAGSDNPEYLRAGLKEGNLKFILKGKKLKGEFALVRMKDSEQNAWLLIKHNDQYALKSKFNAEDLVPQTVKKVGADFKKKEKPGHKQESIERVIPNLDSFKKPMLASLVKEPFDKENWIFEEKLDGYRSLAFLNGEEVHLYSRSGQDFSNAYKTIRDALIKINADAIIDGEIVAQDDSGKNSFQALQNLDEAQGKYKLVYVVFDILELSGHDLRGMPLYRRKELLNNLFKSISDEHLHLNEYTETRGTSFFNKAAKAGWEGIMAKDKESLYYNGLRSSAWLKIKRHQSQEAIIAGYTEPSGSRRYFGALVLGVYNGHGKLKYIGNCGTGFTEATLLSIYKQLEKLKIARKPIKEKLGSEAAINWVKPVLVCEVTYTEWTNDQRLRHPVFKGLRPDKQIKSVTKEMAMKIPELQAGLPANDEQEIQFGRKKVKLSNRNKIYWPKEEITKGQLIDYYQSVSSFILPHLKDRPLSLNRHPNGISAAGFFQKDLDTDQIPSWIKYATMPSKHPKKEIDYLICNDEATLLWMANLGCIEINPWLSTYKKPDMPLFAVLDLDPHDIDFKELIKVSLGAKEILDKMKITVFIKTSGSKGLHLFIPLTSGYDYEIAKNFIHYLGGLLHNMHPDTTSLERMPSKRKSKIYLDFLQNRKGQTIAAPYSVRPKPGATVSAPLNWSEVNEGLRIQDFTIFNMAARLKEKGDIWEDILKNKNNLKKALTQLKGVTN